MATDDESETWNEVEADPVVFTSLVERLGVTGIKVIELYELESCPVETIYYGVIFLFPWTGKVVHRYKRKKIDQSSSSSEEEEEEENSIFFAKQMIPNSCGTHAVLSIVLNCEQIQIGELLTQYKMNTQGMSPEDRGWAIGNIPEIFEAHHSAASLGAECRTGGGGSRIVGSSNHHFTTFVPLNGSVYELDGLKDGPINHGCPVDNGRWMEHCLVLINNRIKSMRKKKTTSSLGYCLLALVPNDGAIAEEENRTTLIEQTPMKRTRKLSPPAKCKSVVACKKRNISSRQFQKSLPVGKASIGKAAVGKASVGKASVGKASVGKASVGKASVGKASVGKASVGKAAVGKASVGKAAVGKTSIGKTSIRKASIRKTSISKASVGKAAVGKVAVGKPSVRKTSIRKTSVATTTIKQQSHPPAAKKEANEKL